MPALVKPVLSTMWNESPRWNHYVDVAPFESPGSPRDLVRLLRLARAHEAVALLGSVSMNVRYRDLLVAMALARLPRPPRVIITDATWEVRSRKLEARLPLLARAVPYLARAVVRAIDGKHVRFCVLSSDEVAAFATTWGVPPERVVFTPFPATIQLDTPVSDEGYIFAGGNSLRDYDVLEQAVRGTGVPLRIATTWTPSAPMARAEVGPMPHEEFVESMARSHAVVVPLRPAVRSAGQQTYLNAMALGKPVIVTEAPGVRDYIEDGRTGVIVPPDPDRLRAALLDVLDPDRAEHYRAMGERARRVVLERFTVDDYYGCTLLEVIGVPPEPATGDSQAGEQAA